MAKTKYIEALEEQYTKKDAKSVLRYKAPDNKWRYVQTSKDASGGNMPSGGGITEVTWQELKDKRDNGELNPGSLYRITDYQCTTTQENTQSAGHQFDIVLLALSENKLAEEGWAMMHDNIYDVTFADGVTKKCWVYQYEIDGEIVFNVVDIETLLGVSCASDEITINDNKTAEIGMESIELTTPDLPYNYFQNSNLSAWKIWYCLDNDTARFAWADDRLILHEIIISGSPHDYIRTPESDLTIDGVKYYAWVWSSSPEFTLSETPKHGDALYKNFGGMQEIGECDKVFTNGRGVIYRLIDEWNNDVGYDFKNIQYVRKLTDGYYTPDNGTDTWVYTFSYVVDEAIQDGSLSHNYNNTIGPINVTFRYKLNDIVSIDNAYGHVFNTFIGCKGVTIFDDVEFVQFFDCYNLQMNDTIGGIYINKKKVLTES